MAWVKYGAKAIFAGVIAFASGLIAALAALPGTNPQPQDLGWIPWLTIGIASLGAIGTVFGISNGPNPNAVTRRANELKRQIDIDAAARRQANLPPAPPVGSSV